MNNDLFGLNDFYEIHEVDVKIEAFFAEDIAFINVVEVNAKDLPCATYLDNDLWQGVDGIIYKVI